MKQAMSITLLSLTVSFSVTGQSGSPQPKNETHGNNHTAQQVAGASITEARVVGEVTEIDLAAKKLIVKTESGSLVTVLLNDSTSYLRVSPGEESLGRATKITVAEIGVGDKVYARGNVNRDQESVPAQKLVVMSKGDIQKKQEGDSADWQKRGIVGVITALSPTSGEITLNVRAREGEKAVVIAVPEGVRFRRYAADSVRFSDAKPSSFSELKVGDQLRVLVAKGTDPTRVVADQIVSGTFRTIGGVVTAVSPQANEIKITMLGSKKPLTVVVNKDSVFRNMPAQVAVALAQRIQGGQQTVPNPKPQPPNVASAASGKPQANIAGAPGDRSPKSAGDLQAVIDRLPSLNLSEVKPGDVVAVSSTIGADPSRLTAITLVKGIDVLLNALQSPGARARPLVMSTGLPAGVLDVGMGQP